MHYISFPENVMMALIKSRNRDQLRVSPVIVVVRMFSHGRQHYHFSDLDDPAPKAGSRHVDLGSLKLS